MSIIKKNLKRRLYEQRIFHVQDYINAHFSEELSLEMLAGISAFSPFHFHRIFKAIAGETLFDHIQRIRLEKSCALLASGRDMRIIDIALHCGFSTPSSFSKAFRKMYKISPAAYRRNVSRKSNIGTCNSNYGKEIKTPEGYICSRDSENIYNRRNDMDVRIEMMPEYRIAYMRRIGKYGPGNIHTMESLKKWAKSRDLLDDSAIILGIAQDDPDVTPPEKCRYDACIIIPEDYKPDDGINVNYLPGGKYAVCRIEHTAEAITKGWGDLFSVWLPESGFQIDDRPYFERYVSNGKSNNVDCEICIPVKPL